MKLFFIKIGKAFGVLRRDGFVNGARRIFSAFFALFKRVNDGDILFITGGVGDSAMYRAHHVAEELEFNDLKCSVTVQDNPFLVSYAKKFKVFIFHRVLFTLSVEKLIQNIKKENKEIIFETDDLVYDSKYLENMDYFKKMNSFEKRLYENGVGGEILMDPYTKVCTTTTSYLAEKLKENDKKVFIVSNKLSREDIEIADEILKQKKIYNGIDTKIKIGYFSGTLSHNKDFATITDALMLIMEKYSNVELFLVGPLDIENNLNKFKNRIKQLKFVPRRDHFKNIASVDINIVPLEIGNPFCESKSELKFFEAGMVGVPTIAAATQTFKESINDGIDGFVANGNEEWLEKVSALIEDEELRISMGKKAREKVLERYITENGKSKEFYSYLKSKIEIN